MKKRYCVTYVGDDSRSHKVRVWASDHKAAVRKVRDKGVDYVTSVRKATNPFVVAAIILAVIALVIVEIVK